MTPEHVSYATLEAAPAVLLVGFEPEEESPIVFLRLHKSTSKRPDDGLVGRRCRFGWTRQARAARCSRPFRRQEATAIDALDSAVIDALSADGAVDPRR